MPYLGIDLGATNIVAALVDDSGLIIRQSDAPTLAKRPACKIIEDMAGLSYSLLTGEGLSQKDIIATGIGVPGLVDPKTGMVHLSPNLFWEQLPLKDMLLEYLSTPLYITNDANCAALAELFLGVFRSKQSAVLLTLGSGIGGGLILGGKLYIGAHGAAGEIGHMVVQLDGELCTCGNRGCFERYASADALTRMSFGTSIAAREVIDAARAGEKDALEVFGRYIYNLSKGIVSIINLYDPEIVALGGGVSLAGDFLLMAVREEVAKHLFLKGYPTAEIVLASLGSEAGVIGAALYARQEELTK
jgi:glucokinase